MPSFDRQAVLESLSRLVTPGIKLTALADELGARKHEYTALRALMVQLVEEGTVEILPGGAFKLAPSGRPNDRSNSRQVPGAFHGSDMLGVSMPPFARLAPSPGAVSRSTRVTA